jgi:hypothetical protein
MSEEENKNVIQPEVDEVEVEVVDSQEAATATTKEDELESYTKGVSKRINKLNERNRLAEEKAARLELALQEKEQLVNSYYNHAAQSQANLLAKEEEAVQSKEREADELYKKAHASGDAGLMSKADTLKSELAIQKEKVRIAKQKQEQSFQQQPVQQQPVQQQPVQQAQPEVQPSEQALEWKANKKWFGDQTDANNVQATQFAMFTHYNLINEGYEADSDEYYQELDSRIYKVYPDLESGEVEQKEGRPAVQRVASASVGSRQKTQGKKNGVTFSKAEVERLRGLKPHNMSEDMWLKSVAKEKQKIATREAK